MLNDFTQTEESITDSAHLAVHETSRILQLILPRDMQLIIKLTDQDVQSKTVLEYSALILSD